MTAAFPEIVDALREAVKADCILDGEIISMKEKRPDISATKKGIFIDSSLIACLLARNNPAQ